MTHKRDRMYAAYHGKELVCVGYDTAALQPGIDRYRDRHRDVTERDITVRTMLLKPHPRWFDATYWQGMTSTAEVAA